MLPLLLALVAVAAQDDTAAVQGRVTLQGKAPAPRKFKAFDEKSQAAYPDGVTVEPVLLDKDRHVRSALVYVKSGLEGKTFPVPKEPRRLDVENFQLAPRMMGIMVGQELIVTSKDPVMHAVHALPWKNKEFNTGLTKVGQSFKATFTTPEVAIKVKTECLHDWERAWVAVLAHPFYAVTDEQGRYEIKGLPPGKYTIEVWQEFCGPVSREIEVQSKETKTVDFVLEPRIQVHLFISGRVQGVGFRLSTEEEAKMIGGLVGWVKNLADGRVEAVVQGPPDKVDRLVEWCRKGPPNADVTNLVRTEERLSDDLKTFEVRY